MRAFSLIELLVVITIVGVLSAIAVPAYNRYVVNTKYSSAIALSSSFITKVIQYYSVHGEFPTSVSSLGLTPSGSNPAATEVPTSLSEYIAQPYLAVIDISPTSSIGSCPGIQIISNSSNFGDGDIYTNGGPPGHTLINAHILYDVNGTFRVICYYQLIDISVGAPEHPNLSGCIDILDPSGAQEYNDVIADITAQCT